MTKQEDQDRATAEAVRKIAPRIGAATGIRVIVGAAPGESPPPVPMEPATDPIPAQAEHDRIQKLVAEAVADNNRRRRAAFDAEKKSRESKGAKK